MGTLAFQTSSLNHLLSSEHDLNFDQRDDVKNQHGSNGNNNNVPSTDDDDDCTVQRNDGTLIGRDITE